MAIKEFEEENMKLKSIIESGIIENREDIRILTSDMTRMPLERGLNYDVIKIYSDGDITCIVTGKTKEEDDKEVTDKNMMEYAIAIKKYCDGSPCEECVFYNIGREQCVLHTVMPYEWGVGGDEEED